VPFIVANCLSIVSARNVWRNLEVNVEVLRATIFLLARSCETSVVGVDMEAIHVMFVMLIAKAILAILMAGQMASTLCEVHVARRQGRHMLIASWMSPLAIIVNSLADCGTMLVILLPGNIHTSL
jgi:hypothetical protein